MKNDKAHIHLYFLVEFWVLQLQLIYFASVAGFWFQTVDRNNALSGRFGSVVDAKDNISAAAIFLAISGMTSYYIIKKYKTVLCVFMKSRFVCLGVLLAFVSCIWSQFPLQSMLWCVPLLFESLFVVYLFSKYTTNELLKMFYLNGWICLIFSFVLIFLFPDYGISHRGFDLEGTWQGMYGQKNTCSMITEYYLVCALYVKTNSNFQRIAKIIYIVLSIIMVLGTQSSTGILCTTFILGYYVYSKFIDSVHRKQRALFLLVAIGALCIMTFYASVNWSSITQVLGKDATLTGRTDIWAAALISVKKRIFLGYGYNAFWTGFTGEAANVSLINGWSSVYAHSGYLNILTSFGAIGLLFFAGSMVKNLIAAVRQVLRKKSNIGHWVVCVMLLTIIINIDEVTVLVARHLSWLMYILSYLISNLCISNKEKNVNA